MKKMFDKIISVLKKYSIKKRVRVGVFVALGVLIVLIIYPLLFSGNAQYQIPRHVRYGFTIQNTTNRLVKQGLFRTWAPVKQTSYQICKNVTASLPFRTLADRFGNRMLEFELKDVPPYAAVIITVSADLMMSESPTVLKQEDTEFWLRPEPYVESDDPDIVNTAKKLKTAKKIFKWTAEHVKYGGPAKKDSGARYAFEHKKGDSTEIMYLFTALCRSAGIPARCVAGYIAEENSVFIPMQFHNWSEFYDNRRWYPADVRNGVFKIHGKDYIAMRIITRPPEKPEMALPRFQVIGEGLTAGMNGE